VIDRCAEAVIRQPQEADDIANRVRRPGLRLGYGFRFILRVPDPEKAGQVPGQLAGFVYFAGEFSERTGEASLSRIRGLAAHSATSL
jgi:hypothetical protein